MSSTTDSHAVSYLVGNQDELVYDYLISLGAEIQLVWKAPWKLGKFLYFLTRYLAFAGAVVKVFLNEGRFLSLGTCNVLSKTMSLILFLRVWAIWGNSRKIAGLLVIGFLIPAPIVSICVLLRAPKSQNNSDFYESVLHNKFGLCPPFLIDSNGIIVMFAYLAVYEAVILALTISIQGKKTWSIWKSHFFCIQVLSGCKLSCKYNYSNNDFWGKYSLVSRFRPLPAVPVNFLTFFEFGVPLYLVMSIN
ncbi:hypothetical protein K435DRAFT_792898 [Dendrothele bispora CBS 962.96]|uniref:DUF6533 domain-containing protein n=1 Tax=Dendrothele bispora (strain CBS 962.96) TaxID=1314807 RepID=A0A4S8MH97_DENBC|nr:hypothetical protein K435DRAFT_792898 [Dendrothele bispora CBS 962.96]